MNPALDRNIYAIARGRQIQFEADGTYLQFKDAIRANSEIFGLTVEQVKSLVDQRYQQLIKESV